MPGADDANRIVSVPGIFNLNDSTFQKESPASSVQSGGTRTPESNDFAPTSSKNRRQIK